MLVIKLKIFIRKTVNIFKRKFSSHISKNTLFGPNVQIFGLNNISVGNNCTIGENSVFTVNNRSNNNIQLTIGANVYVGRDTYFSVGHSITLRDYVIMGNKCALICSDHVFDNPLVPYALSGNSYTKSIKIGVNCWLGHDVCILGNITVGHGSIIGAKTVIVKDVPPFSMVVGNPGKVIKTYNFETNKWEAGELNINTSFLDEEKYLQELKNNGGKLSLAYYSASSRYGDL